MVDLLAERQQEMFEQRQPTNEEKEEHGKTSIAYDIFDEDGIYMANVWLDISPEIFKNGKMYTRESDRETGYRKYKRYRIDWIDKQ